MGGIYQLLKLVHHILPPCYRLREIVIFRRFENARKLRMLRHPRPQNCERVKITRVQKRD